MTTYSVKYKKPEWIFWRTLKGIKGDGILFQQNGDITRPVPDLCDGLFLRPRLALDLAQTLFHERPHDVQAGDKNWLEAYH